MFYFKYDKKINGNYWKHLITVGTKFGHKFPKTFKIEKSDAITAEKTAIKFQEIWNKYEKTFRENFYTIYNCDFPRDMKCYINTSPYSMFNVDKNYISISMMRTCNNFISTVLHEANHFIFIKYYSDFCRSIDCSSEDISEIKEIVTIINNDVFSPMEDSGWELYQKYRERALVVWKKNKDIKKVIIDAKKALDKKRRLGVVS